MQCSKLLTIHNQLVQPATYDRHDFNSQLATGIMTEIESAYEFAEKCSKTNLESCANKIKVAITTHILSMRTSIQEKVAQNGFQVDAVYHGILNELEGANNQLTAKDVGTLKLFDLFKDVPLDFVRAYRNIKNVLQSLLPDKNPDAIFEIDPKGRNCSREPISRLLSGLQKIHDCLQECVDDKRYNTFVEPIIKQFRQLKSELEDANCNNPSMHSIDNRMTFHLVQSDPFTESTKKAIIKLRETRGLGFQTSFPKQHHREFFFAAARMPRSEPIRKVLVGIYRDIETHRWQAQACKVDSRYSESCLKCLIDPMRQMYETIKDKIGYVNSNIDIILESAKSDLLMPEKVLIKHLKQFGEEYFANEPMQLHSCFEAIVTNFSFNRETDVVNAVNRHIVLRLIAHVNEQKAFIERCMKSMIIQDCLKDLVWMRLLEKFNELEEALSVLNGPPTRFDFYLIRMLWSLRVVPYLMTAGFSLLIKAMDHNNVKVDNIINGRKHLVDSALH